jgi:hypothetical protein
MNERCLTLLAEQASRTFGRFFTASSLAELAPLFEGFRSSAQAGA